MDNKTAMQPIARGQAPGGSQTAPQAGSPGYNVTGQRLMVIMISVLLGVLLAALDQTVVGPAMPRIIGDLNGFEQYSWVFTIYLLTSTITVPIFGKLSDMYGRKWFYIAGIVVFLIGSALSGFSQDIWQLIAFRGVQGLGAGILMANAFAIIADLIPPRDRGKWQGVFGSVWGLASVVGPTVGGYLTDNLSWRWVFYVNLPVGVIALAALIIIFPNESRQQARKVIDWLGAFALAAGLTPLLIALSNGGTPDWDWNSGKILGLFALAIFFLVAFVFIERRAPEAIIPLDLFKNGIFSWSMLTVFVTGIGLFGAILYIPLFIQAIQGDSATSSGNAITPMTLSLVVASILSGQIVSRTGRYRMVGIAGMVLGTLGMFLLYTMNMDTGRWTTIAFMVVLGLGMGVTFPLYTLIVQNAFPIQRVGVVTAALQFARSVGSTVGVAILGSVVNTQFHDHFPQEFAKQVAALPSQTASRIPVDQFAKGLSNANPQALVSPEGAAQLHSQLISQFHVPAAFADQLMTLIKDAMRPALFTGIQEAFLIGTVLLGLGVITTAFIKEIPLRKTNWSSGAALAEGGATGAEGAAEEAGREILAGGPPYGAEIPAEEEPVLTGRS